MKTTLTLFFIFLVSNISAQPNTWVWAKSFGNYGEEYSNDVCADANGNIFTVGTFVDSSLTLGNTTLHNNNPGHNDIFVVKYDASGNVLWAKSLIGSGYDLAYSICIDANGDVYITGQYHSYSLDFGDTIIYNSDGTGLGQDMFIAKYDTDGNLLWVRSAVGRNDWEYTYDICTDQNNNIYIAGEFKSDSLLVGSDTLLTRGFEDAFLLKLDADGNFIWAKSAGGTYFDAGTTVCSDGAGNIYLAGYFAGHAIFDNDTIVAGGTRTVFISKYDTDGNVIWARGVEGVVIVGNPLTYSQGVVANQTGDVYLTGFFMNSIIFENDTLTCSPGSTAVFLTKYDSNGNVVWAKSPAQTGMGSGQAGGICIDIDGNVFTSGFFEGDTIDFGGITLIKSDTTHSDGYLAQYNPAGQVLWATSIAGNNYDYPAGVFSSGNNIYLTGYFVSDTIDIGGNILLNQSDSNRTDFFLAKFDIVTGIVESSFSSWNLYPNPAHEEFTISNDQSTSADLEIFNLIGEKIYSNVFSKRETIREKFSPGIYFLKINDGGKHFTKKLIVQ